MSKKYEVTSCFMCPHYSRYGHDGTVYDTAMAQCSAYADGDTVVGKVFEDMQIPNFIWDECPLEAYDQPVLRWAEKPVISRNTITNAFGLKERSPIREEYENHVSTPETVAPAPVEMQELMVIIDEAYATNTYYAPDGNLYNEHPSKTNEFIHKVNESGGNILSINKLPDQNKFVVHYSVPMGTYPITI